MTNPGHANAGVLLEAVTIHERNQERSCVRCEFNLQSPDPRSLRMRRAGSQDEPEGPAIEAAMGSDGSRFMQIEPLSFVAAG